MKLDTINRLIKMQKFICNDETRPSLMYLKITKIDDEKFTAIACNGFIFIQLEFNDIIELSPDHNAIQFYANQQIRKKDKRLNEPTSLYSSHNIDFPNFNSIIPDLTAKLRPSNSGFNPENLVLVNKALDNIKPIRFFETKKDSIMIIKFTHNIYSLPNNIVLLSPCILDDAYFS